jgi:hypothetical protein
MRIQIAILLLFTLSVFGQEENDSLRTEKTKIESGAIIKNYNPDNQLHSFIVEISTAYYGNLLFFTKEKDTIFIKNLREKDAIIKIYVKNQKKISEFIYKGKKAGYIEVFDFDINNLPKQSFIYSKIEENQKLAYLYQANLPTETSSDYDKSYKLHLFLKTSENNVNINLLFNEIADYFSKDDALLRIYLSKYRAKIQDESLESITGYLTTDDFGKIKNGILWTENPSNTGEYKIYKNGKIIKSENITLSDFQKIFTTYSNENYADFNN